MGDLTLVYRLWIVAGDSKFRYWIVVPVATAVVGAGKSLHVVAIMRRSETPKLIVFKGFGIFNSVSIFFETSYNLIDASSLLGKLLLLLPISPN